MNKDDFGDIVKLMKDTWTFWEPSSRESRAFGVLFKQFSFEEAEAAIKAHRTNQLKLRQTPQAPEIDYLRKLLTCGESKSPDQLDFERWFHGNPPHHRIDGVPDSTAVRIRRLLYQRDVDRRRLLHDDTEAMSHDRLDHRVALTNRQLQEIQAARPENYERGARSYTESRNRVGGLAEEAAIEASRGNWEPDPVPIHVEPREVLTPPAPKHEHAREEIHSDLPF